MLRGEGELRRAMAGCSAFRDRRLAAVLVAAPYIAADWPCSSRSGAR